MLQTQRYCLILSKQYDGSDEAITHGYIARWASCQQYGARGAKQHTALSRSLESLQQSDGSIVLQPGAKDPSQVLNDANQLKEGLLNKNSKHTHLLLLSEAVTY